MHARTDTQTLAHTHTYNTPTIKSIFAVKKEYYFALVELACNFNFTYEDN